MLSDKKNLDEMDDSEREFTTTYGSRYFTKSVPKYEMPKTGIMQGQPTRLYTMN